MECPHTVLNGFPNTGGDIFFFFLLIRTLSKQDLNERSERYANCTRSFIVKPVSAARPSSLTNWTGYEVMRWEGK